MSTYINFISSGEPGPGSISGLALWLIPDPATMFTDTGGTTPVASDGDSVAHWADQSGNDKDVTQGTGSAQPLYKVNIENSLPMILFDGAGDQLANTWLGQKMCDGNDQSWTAAVVFKKTANSGTDWIISTGDTFGPSRTQFGTEAAADYIVDKIDSLGSEVFKLGGAPDTSIHVLIVRMNGATCDAWADSSQVITAETIDVAAQSNTGGNIGITCAGYIGEVVLYDNAISNDDVTTLQNYLIAEWAI